MELLLKTCSAKLFLRSCLEPLCKICLAKHCEAIAWAFAWNCRTKASLQSYFLSFCMELSCKSCLATVFHKLLHAAGVQMPPCKTISQAFARNCRAKVALQSYSGTSCVDVSCKSCLSKLFPKLSHGIIVRGSSFKAISCSFSWNCRAEGISQSYLAK